MIAFSIVRRAALCAALLSSLVATSFAAAAPLEAVVGVHASVPQDARTARSLGTDRAGTGIVIDDKGLVLTIGYLVMEAISAELVLPGNRKVPADVVAYDYETGFGLLRALAPLGVTPMPLGDSATLTLEAQVLVAGSSGTGQPQVTGAVVVSRREFAGYWEYLLPDAIFTAPPHFEFGGAALIGRDGNLLGVGSLIVGDAGGPERQMPGNMFVPIDALKPILADLVATGRSKVPPRPWLGISSEEARGRLFVTRVAPGGPAAKAGVAANDIIVAVAGEPVLGQADFYKKVWALGKAGTEVPLTLLSGRGLNEIKVISASRYDHLKLKPSY
jgi:S1-C subfamily serine protease